jgi:hypothetical protein
MVQPMNDQMGSQIEPEAVDLRQVAERYQKARFAYMPQFLTTDQAVGLLAATHNADSRRVICGIEEVTWDEQNFDPSDPAYQFFQADKVMDVVRRVSGLEAVRQLKCWTSCYRVEEYINPHRDGEG